MRADSLGPDVQSAPLKALASNELDPMTIVDILGTRGVGAGPAVSLGRGEDSLDNQDGDWIGCEKA